MRIAVLLLLIVAALLLFRRRAGRGQSVCPRCGFAALAGTPACPRCGRVLDMSTVDLGRLERARRRGELDDEEYRRRKLALLRAQDASTRADRAGASGADGRSGER